MKILHVITGMQKAAGTTTFVENVVAGLGRAGHTVKIVMSAKDFEQCDVLHIHGLWSRLLHEASLFAERNKIPVVWSTHGMTAPWAMHHKWWKKLPAWWLYQKWDLKKAAVVHCTTDLEVEWNKRLGFEKCFVAPLGCNEPRNTLNTRKGGTCVLLFVGRIYPVKGLENLIRAWGLVEPRNTLNTRKWMLRIVGPDQAGHKAELEKLVGELGVGDSVEFPGPKFGEELNKEYENCDCLALPSFTENFGATVVDAMAHGKPVITSMFTPWREVKDCGCGWWVSNEPRELAGAIKEMMALSDEERAEMGKRGRSLVEEKYTWDAVVKAMVEGYERVVSA